MWNLGGLSVENALPELPEWVMKDFNFETIGRDAFGLGNADLRNTAETPVEMQGNGTCLGVSVGEATPSTNPIGFYSLDMNLDEAMSM